jgi:hypothetical protein
VGVVTLVTATGLGLPPPIIWFPEPILMLSLSLTICCCGIPGIPEGENGSIGGIIDAQYGLIVWY